MDLNELLFRYQIELMQAERIRDCRERQDRLAHARVLAERTASISSGLGAHLPLTLICLSAVDVVMPECV